MAAVSISPEVEKGWVRQEILTLLSAQPSTLSEISRRLGIAKSTASYHLSQLVGKGVVVVLAESAGRGGVQIKSYGLKEGTVVALSTGKEEETEMARLRETFDVFTLRLRSQSEELDDEFVQSLLYRMFLHLFKISKGNHRTLMREYGSRLWAVVESNIPKGSLREVLLNLASKKISELDIIELSNFASTVVVSNSCIGSNFHPTNSCYFFEGMIEGAAKERLSPRVKVVRLNITEVSSCVIAIGKGRKLDISGISEAIVGSPGYLAAGRGIGGGEV